MLALRITITRLAKLNLAISPSVKAGRVHRINIHHEQTPLSPNYSDVRWHAIAGECGGKDAKDPNVLQTALLRRTRSRFDGAGSGIGHRNLRFGR